jgi:hypothetical protein
MRTAAVVLMPPRRSAAAGIIDAVPVTEPAGGSSLTRC